MNLTHMRIENGNPTLITIRTALNEIEAGQMNPNTKRTIKQMSASGSSAIIQYKDGRNVKIRPATPQELTTRR